MKTFKRLKDTLGDFFFGPDIGRDMDRPFFMPQSNDVNDVNEPMIWTYLGAAVKKKRSRYHKLPKGAYGTL